MAEIKVERGDNRGGGGFKWWYLLPLLLIPLLLLRGCNDDEADVAPVATDTTAMAPATTPDPMMAPMPMDTGMAAMPTDTAAAAGAAAGTTGGAIPIATIASTPANYVNQAVSGTARVAEVVSDKGFWIEENGQRMFALLNEPPENARQIRAGQTVQISGTVHDRAGLAQLPIQVEAEARRIIEAQPAFLYIQRPQDVTIATQ